MRQADFSCHTLYEAFGSRPLLQGRMDDIDELTGSRLKAWREKRGLTQGQLAEAIGTTHSQISYLETGERKLSPKWLHKIAPVLKVSPGWLLDYYPDDLGNDIQEIWGAIPEPQRAVARDVLIAFRHKTGTDD